MPVQPLVQLNVENEIIFFRDQLLKASAVSLECGLFVINGVLFLLLYESSSVHLSSNVHLSSK